MSSASSSGRRRSPRLEKKRVHSSAQSCSGWSPESQPNDQEPLPIAKVVLKKMSKEEIAQVTGGETVLGDTSNQRNNTEENTSVLLDVSVIELDQEDNDVQEDPDGDDQEDPDDQEDHDDQMDHDAQEDHELGNGPPVLTDSDVSSEGPLQDLPGSSHSQSELEDVITIDDDEEQDMSVEDDIVILGDQVADQMIFGFRILDRRVVRPLSDALGNSWHTPSVNRNDTTIDLASPRKDNVKAAGSSTTASSALEVPQDAPSREPLTCPICLEGCIALSKENVKLLSLKCGHLTCGPCLQEALQRRPVCPICRAEVRRGDPRQLFI